MHQCQWWRLWWHCTTPAEVPASISPCEAGVVSGICFCIRRDLQETGSGECDWRVTYDTLKQLQTLDSVQNIQSSHTFLSEHPVAIVALWPYMIHGVMKKKNDIMFCGSSASNAWGTSSLSGWKSTVLAKALVRTALFTAWRSGTSLHPCDGDAFFTGNTCITHGIWTLFYPCLL